MEISAHDTGRNETGRSGNTGGRRHLNGIAAVDAVAASLELCCLVVLRRHDPLAEHHSGQRNELKERDAVCLAVPQLKFARLSSLDLGPHPPELGGERRRVQREVKEQERRLGVALHPA